MPTYGLIYQTEYDALIAGTPQRYYDKIYKKNYVGLPSNVLASGKPAQHNWLTDDPKVTIKGSDFTLNLINPGNFPLKNFYSAESDMFRIDHYWGTQLLFSGYLVQTNCTEIQIDIPHEIQLSFTDNLGLLKEISFDAANRLVGPTHEFTGPVSTAIGLEYLRVDSITTGALIGDTMVVTGTTADGTYTIANVVVGPTVTFIYITVPWPFAIAFGSTGTLTFITSQDITLRIPLTKFMEICLKSTNLLLATNIYDNLVVDGGSTGREFDDVYLDGETFLNGNTWMNTYDVAVAILKPRGCSLLQSYGVWNIVRWDELRQYTNNIPGNSYDADMVYVGPVQGIQQFTYGGGSDVEVGLTGSIVGALKFDKETFNYKYPVYINNNNLQLLGSLISSQQTTITSLNINDYPFYNYRLSVGDVILIEKYNFPAASQWLHIYSDVSYIYIISQVEPFGNTELDRFVYQEKITNGLPPGYQEFANVQFNDIEVNAGDVLNFSCLIRTSGTTGSSAVAFRFGFFLQVATGEYYQLVNSAGGGGNEFAWNHFFLTPIQGIGNPFNVISPDNRAYQSFVLSETGLQGRVPKLPADGLLRIRMYGTNDTNVSQPNVDANWKDMRLTISNYINDSIKIIGQTHDSAQSLIIKDNNDETILVDDSPRNTINGTQFLSTFTGLIQDRTASWARGGVTEAKRLGEIITFEQLFYRRISRTKLEGNLLGLVQLGVYRFTGLSIFAYNDVEPTPEFYAYYPDLPPGILVPGVTFTVTGTAHNDGTYLAGPYQSAPLPTPALAVTITVPPGRIADIDVVSTIEIIGVPVHLSMLNVIKYVPEPLLNLIFGTLSIRYKDNQANGTIYEIWQDGEVDADLKSLYEFRYLYDKT